MSNGESCRSPCVCLRPNALASVFKYPFGQSTHLQIQQVASCRALQQVASMCSLGALLHPRAAQGKIDRPSGDQKNTCRTCCRRGERLISYLFKERSLLFFGRRIASVCLFIESSIATCQFRISTCMHARRELLFIFMFSVRKLTNQPVGIES
jgi:hypothetical protein